MQLGLHRFPDDHKPFFLKKRGEKYQRDIQTHRSKINWQHHVLQIILHKTQHRNWRLTTRTPRKKTWGDLRCSGRVSRSCLNDLKHQYNLIDQKIQMSNVIWWFYHLMYCCHCSVIFNIAIKARGLASHKIMFNQTFFS